MAEGTPKTSAGGKQDVGGAERLVEQGLADAQASLDQLRNDAPGAAASAVAGNDLSSLMADEEVEGETVDPDGISLLHDVDLSVSIELGRTTMLVEDVLRLSEGSVVELDKLAGDPVDLFVNGRLVARGEVLVLNDNFCIRISEILTNLDDEAEQLIEESRSKPSGGQKK